VGLTYLWRDGRDEEPETHLLTVSASLRLGKVGSLHLTGRQSFADKPGSAIELALVVPLGGRTSASAGGQLGRGGSGLNAAVQKNLPAASASAIVRPSRSDRPTASMAV
jgi:outer membrane usher protein FimD/PapC